MTENQEGVKNDELENTPAAVEEEQEEEKGEETSIPVKALKKIRGELQDSKSEKKMLEQELALYKANMPQGQQVQQPQPVQNDEGPFGDLNDDDIVTVKHMKEALLKQDAYYQGVVSELQLGTQDKNFSQVISDYLPQALKDDPSLRAIIKNSRDPLGTAYKFAQYAKKEVDAVKPTKKEGISKDDPISVIDSILAGAQKIPTSPSAVGGGGSGLSGGDVYKDMSDEEVDKEFAKLGVQI